MLEVIAGIPFKNGVDTLCRQQFLLLANAVANLCHYGVLRFLFLITEAEINGSCQWLVDLCILHPLRVPDRWRYGCDTIK